MTIPNVGVTGVIQDPGLGGTLARGVGGIAQMLMQQQQLQDQRAKDAVAASYTNAMTDKLRSDMSTAAADRQAALDLQKRNEEQAIVARDTLIASMGTQLNPGQIASLKSQPPAEAAKWLQQSFFPEVQKFGKDDRGIRVNPLTGKTETVVEAGVPLPQMSDMPADLREAVSVALKRDPRDPATFMAPLSEQEAQAVDSYINRKVATGANRSTTTILNDTAAAAGATEAVKTFGELSKRAFELKEDNAAIDRMLRTLDDGVLAGPLGGRSVAAGALLVELGLIDSDTPDNTRIYMSQVADRTLPLMRKLAPVTDLDREWMQAARGGDITKMSAKGLRQMLMRQQQGNTLDIRAANDRIRRSSTLRPETKADFIVDIDDDMPPTKQFRLSSGKVITGTWNKAVGKYLDAQGQVLE